MVADIDGRRCCVIDGRSDWIPGYETPLDIAGKEVNVAGPTGDRG